MDKLQSLRQSSTEVNDVSYKSYNGNERHQIEIQELGRSKEIRKGKEIPTANLEIRTAKGSVSLFRSRGLLKPLKVCY
ncbi:hypothetical protein RB195_017719 [Necator americanus]